MALLPGGSFRTEDAPESSFEPLPAGEYTVLVKDTEVKETSTGGEMLKITLEVQEPEEYAGRYIWDNLNLVNASEKAVEIAQRQLASICKACGIEEIEDSQELHGIPMLAKVKVTPEQGGYGPGNAVTGYKSFD